MALPDRLEVLLAQNDLTGIDFVLVHEDQVQIDVFFLKQPSGLTNPIVAPQALDKVTIRAPGEPPVALTATWQQTPDGRDFLHIVTVAPGGFGPYWLRIDDARIDPLFNDVEFSFKAACPRDVDCAPPPHECPPEPRVDFPVDYLARDFFSLRGALLEFAAQRYPEWQDRLEADVGVMLAEVMSAVGDEFAYTQDRVARESALETATQRRSVRRLARLVDYELHDGHGARTWLDVTAAAAGSLPAGTPVQAVPDALATVVSALVSPVTPDGPNPDGAPLPVTFEVGRGLADMDRPGGPVQFGIHPARNALTPHLWDASQACLPVGATELYLAGHHQADLPLDDAPSGRPPGRFVLLRTDPLDRSLPARRWIVRLIEVEDTTDPLVADPLTGNNVTRIAWEDAQALPFELDQTSLTVRGNLVPATAGRTVVRRFSVGPSDFEALEPPVGGDPATFAPVPPAVERSGPNGSIAYLYSLLDPEREGLVWLGARKADPRTARPELRLAEATLSTPPSPPKWNGSQWDEHDRWDWRRALLGVDSSQPEDRHFTLDDGVWTRVVGFRRGPGELVHRDYALGGGVTVRFGDGEFGAVPDPTSSPGTVFEATYRLGNGSRGNVGPDSLVVFDKATLGALVNEITNPLPAAGGVDPEPLDDVRRFAPDAFRAVTFRAVRPEDYAEAAERLDWVQRAGASFRWTGSWLTAFTTPDPRGAAMLSPALRTELEEQLDRFRQAGRESHVLDPVYADIDLEIDVCIETSSYGGEVIPQVLTALLGKRGPAPRRGFFDPDNFTFGDALERSRLEAVIQSVPGVRAVEEMRIRRRGFFNWRPFDQLFYPVAADEVIRLQNDAEHPERGTLRVFPKGGA